MEELPAGNMEEKKLKMMESWPETITLLNKVHTQILGMATLPEHLQYELSVIRLHPDGHADATNGRIVVISLNHHKPFGGTELVGIQPIKLKAFKKFADEDTIYLNKKMLYGVFGNRVYRIKPVLNFPSVKRIIPSNLSANEGNQLTRICPDLCRIQLLVQKLCTAEDNYPVWRRVNNPNSQCVLMHGIPDLLVVGMQCKKIEDWKFKESPGWQALETYITKVNPKKKISIPVKPEPYPEGMVIDGKQTESVQEPNIVEE